MSVTVTVPDHRPTKQPEGADMFGPTRYRDVRHPAANRFVITECGELIVLNITRAADDSKPLSQFTVAAYPSGQWISAVRR